MLVLIYVYKSVMLLQYLGFGSIFFLLFILLENKLLYIFFLHELNLQSKCELQKLYSSNMVFKCFSCICFYHFIYTAEACVECLG